MFNQIEDFLASHHITGYVVGGYVRDSLLNRPTRDVDIAILGDALTVARAIADALGGSYVLLDAEQGIARVVLSEPLSSAAQSAEEGQSAAVKRWSFDFSTILEDIESDLLRRDFTINAMAIPLGSIIPEILDPYQGRDDLEMGRIRVVMETAFQDDPARLLRAVRLAAEYGFAIETSTEALIREQGHLLSQVAGERIREELCHLLALPGAASHLLYLDQLGLLTILFPELAQAKGVEQPQEHFWDVFQHSLHTVAALEYLLSGEDIESKNMASVSTANLYFTPEIALHFQERIGNVERSSLIKLAALLHDIAKPKTKNLESDGRTHFFGHASQGAVMAKEIMGRLRFSAQQSKAVQRMVEHHLRPWQMGPESVEPTRRAIYRYFRDTSDTAIDILWLALSDYLATQGPRLDPAEWEKHVRMISYILCQGLQGEQNIISPPKLIDGDDLIHLFGLKPGRQVGEVLQAVREAQAAGEIATRDEALALAQRQISH